MISILYIFHIHRIKVGNLIHRGFRYLFVTATLVTADAVVVCLQTALSITLIVLISGSFADVGGMIKRDNFLENGFE